MYPLDRAVKAVIHFIWNIWSNKFIKNYWRAFLINMVSICFNINKNAVHIQRPCYKELTFRPKFVSNSLAQMHCDGPTATNVLPSTQRRITPTAVFYVLFSQQIDRKTVCWIFPLAKALVNLSICEATGNGWSSSLFQGITKIGAGRKE